MLIGYLAILGLLVLVVTAAQAQENLLTNPGFEDARGWKNGWTIEETTNTGAPYVYRIGPMGGGHGTARPYTGSSAIEIYSSDRITRLSQSVQLAPGTYRLSAWGRNNGNSGDNAGLRVSLGDRTVTVPVLSDRYRQYYADFDIAATGMYEAAFVSVSLGDALDDISLTRVERGAANPIPYLYFDLSPTSEERSAGLQYYIKGQRQWVNFTVSTTDPRRLDLPVIRFWVPQQVVVSGFNHNLLKALKPNKLDAANAVLTVTSETLDGKVYNVYSMPVIRFVGGFDRPTSWGGFWVYVPEGSEQTIGVELMDGGRLISQESIRLTPVAPPSRQVTPKLYKIVSYDVQDWKTSLPERLETLPGQFAMMGLNVWSEYQMTRLNAEAAPTAEDQVMAKAARDYGVKEFWPNYSQLLDSAQETDRWGVPERYSDPDMHVVAADGTVELGTYNMRYAANNGPRGSSRLWQLTSAR